MEKHQRELEAQRQDDGVPGGNVFDVVDALSGKKIAYDLDGRAIDEEEMSKSAPAANKTHTLAEPNVKEDTVSAFPPGTVPTIEVPVNNTASAEELKKLEELHAKKGGEQKIEEKKEEKKDDKKKTLA